MTNAPPNVASMAPVTSIHTASTASKPSPTTATLMPNATAKFVAKIGATCMKKGLLNLTIW
jgi:hypothetical protein